jgi:hypothetical protein
MLPESRKRRTMGGRCGNEHFMAKKQKIHKSSGGWTLAECFLCLYGNHRHGDLKHSYRWEDVTCKNCLKYKPK